MKFRTWCSGAYSFCVSIPDRLYPFTEMVERERVRGKAAYDQALARIQEERGYGHYGAFLITYRGIFHVAGALLFILFCALVSHDLFGSDVALYVLITLAAVAIAYQEFRIQPKTHGQLKLHSVIDLLSWVVPFGVYLFIHLT